MNFIDNGVTLMAIVITNLILLILVIVFLTLYILKKKEHKIEVKKLESELKILENSAHREKVKLNKEIEQINKEFDGFRKDKEIEIQEIREEYTSDISKLTNKHNKEIFNLKEEFKKKSTSKDFIESSLETVNKILKNKYRELNNDIDNKENELKTLREQVELFEEKVEMLERGVYQPRYNFSKASQYERKLNAIRDEQKLMMTIGTATNIKTTWTLNDSEKEGERMTQKRVKQILRSFNSECDVQISKITYRNIKTTEQRINTIFAQLNKLYSIDAVELDEDYLNLKIQEMYLAFEYAEKKNEEKDILKHERYLEREKRKEEKILNEEIQEEKQKINREMTHYKKLLRQLNKKLDVASSTKSSESIYEEIEKVENKIEEKKKAKEDLDFRESHLSAGYVYIISNIGAFGKDVVKIGVTRRLEPYNRIRELSSASVPFTYDVHALIFSYNAFELEKELHTHFDKNRINKINNRKEFFKVSIDEIEEKLEDYGDLTFNFNRDAEALEYYQTKQLEEKRNII